MRDIGVSGLCPICFLSLRVQVPNNHMGIDQNYGPFLGSALWYIPSSLGDQKGPIILINPHILSQIFPYITTILNPSTLLLGPLDPWGTYLRKQLYNTSLS